VLEPPPKMPPLDEPELGLHPEPDREGLCRERPIEVPRDRVEEEVPMVSMRL
jgi:hypothetical protein